MLTLPNVLSGLRLALAPTLLVLAWQGYALAFLVCATVSLSSDLIDGFLARRFGQASELGAKLDSWGDLATYAILPFCVWWLWPELIWREAFTVAVAIFAFVAPTAIGLIKFGRFTSYHTWGAKVSAVLFGPSLLVFLLLGWPWAFRFATAIFLLAELEEIAITAVLPEWRADVRSIVHARRFVART
jgi:CDP-diacylglycerol--glycerol-3-phosphate 3-phosphatidyltransferase